MARPRNIHVVPDDGEWAIKREGNAAPLAHFPTQSAAIRAGRSLAQEDRTDLVIHRPDGRIRDRDSYGNDPMPPRDTKH